MLSHRTDDRSRELTFFSSSFSLSPSIIPLFPGEKAHHRPVRGPEGWAQPDFSARGPLWSHPGTSLICLTHILVFVSSVVEAFIPDSKRHSLEMGHKLFKSTIVEKAL